MARALGERLPPGGLLAPELHVEALATALHFGRSAIFLRHATWARRFLVHRGVPDAEVAFRLEALGGAILQHLDGPSAGAALHLVALAVDVLSREPREEPACIHAGGAQQALLEHALRGDRAAERHLVAASLASGMPAAHLVLRVLEPVLLEIGRLWQVAQVDVPGARSAIDLVAGLLATARDAIPPQPAREHVALCACAPGEAHALGLGVVADFLERDGWTVHRLGPGPAGEVLSLLERTGAHLLALSVTLDIHLPATEALVAQVRAARPGVRILLGGMPMRTYPRLWEQMGADGTGSNAEAAAAAAAELMLGDWA